MTAPDHIAAARDFFTRIGRNASESDVESLARTLGEVRRKAIEEAAKACDPVRTFLESQDMPAVAGGYAFGAVSSCQRCIRELLEVKS